MNWTQYLSIGNSVNININAGHYDKLSLVY